MCGTSFAFQRVDREAVGPDRRSRTRGSSTIELRLVRRRPPTRAATKAVSGQADIGREVLRPMWPSKGRGVTSAPCSSQEGRLDTQCLLCRRLGDPRGYKKEVDLRWSALHATLKMTTAFPHDGGAHS